MSKLLLLCVFLLKYVSCQDFFSLSIGKWSECQRIDSSFILYKTRNVACVYKDSWIAPWYYCQQIGFSRPTNRTICDTVMPVDCVTSLWSSWSFANSASIQYRHRSIVLPPKFGGQGCPHTYERKLCNNNCNMTYLNYQWKIWNWGSCEALLGSSNCGYGIRHRNITCVNRYGHTVNDSECSALFKPHNFASEKCEVPCDCIVSEWSSWSKCELNYDTAMYQQIRTRVNVNYLPRIHSARCPTLQETRPCKEDCNFTYEVSGWSNSCKLYNSNTNCGAGLRARYLYCRKSCRNHTMYVDLSECKIYLNSPPVTYEPCFSTCDQDCILSQWSEWSQCTPFKSCNNKIPGYTFRERSIVMPQSRSGRYCQHTTEIRSCVPDHCIPPRWHIKRISSCHLTSNMTCGPGVITRVIDCVDYRGLGVSFDECQNEKPSETIPCQVPCPDECVISEWSMWSLCSKTCTGGIRKRNRYVVAYGVTNCSMSDLQETEICNEQINCTSYEVRYSEWSKCSSLIALNVSSGYCNNGTQTRTATCKFENSTVSCPGFYGRDVSKDCTECRNDCIKSEWHYSPCSLTCGEGGYRLKYRVVLWQGENGTCANIDGDGKETVHETCPTMPSCHNYTWATSQWSNCYLPAAEICGIGYKNRTVQCVNSSNHTVENFYCIQNHLQNHVTFMDCVIPCRDQCMLKKWSKFGPCSKSCGDSPGTRLRVRKVILPIGAKGAVDKNCPELEGKTLVEEQLCVVPKCTDYNWMVSNWSLCSTNSICGVGIQVRTVACTSITANSTLFVSNSLCEQISRPPARTKNCTIECPMDCEVSEWKNWEPCSTECGVGTKIRHRTVLQPSNALGRPCPELQQTTICVRRSCGEYKPSEWSTCIISYTTNSTEYCGNGKMFQKYLCYVDGIVSDDLFCNATTIPAKEFQDCYLPCSGDCVLSEWTEDSTACSDCMDSSCNLTSIRSILRQPLPNGKQCESLKKTEFCPNIDEYYWQTGPWLSCILLNEGNLCGSGFHTREIKCICRRDSQIVPDYYCNKGMHKPSHKELCNVKCPVDCMVSAFEPWSACNSSCNINGVQTRYRDTTLQPNEYGRPCPHLMETKHCRTEKKCYKYNLSYSQWSACEMNTKVNYCGNLTKQRSVYCTRNDGVYVHNEKCLEENHNASIQSEETCSVNCKQKEKCQYSGWSNWSSCATVEVRYNVNFKFRYRYLLDYDPNHEVDCLSDQYETKECDDYNSTHLLSFEWKVGHWLIQGSRDIWCVSNNMISVSESACVPTLKPSNTLCAGRCFNEAFQCNQMSGYCQCRAGTELISGQCLPTEGCLTNDHCLLEHTECRYFTCICEQGYHMNNSKCVKDIEPRVTISSPIATSTSSTNSQESNSKH